MTLLLGACGAPGLDEDQVAAERRTCASLRERVAARALAEAGLDEVPPGAEVKPEALSALGLLADPIAWYASLGAALDDAELGPPPSPSGRSPASRLVGTCEDLDG